MAKTILLTGATDGIGAVTAEQLAGQGHLLLLHGRNPEKLAKMAEKLSNQGQAVETYVADLSRMEDVVALAQQVATTHQHLDVLINNAGVFRTANPITGDGLDVRFAVNTLAPYLLTLKLLPLLGSDSRVVNLSSAAQAPVDLNALQGKVSLADGNAYAQSKLAITMWTRHLADKLGDNGPMIVAVNPASLLGSKMVKDAYGIAGGDLQIGADILIRAALSDEFAAASGRYFDNDAGQFANPHADALSEEKNARLCQCLDGMLSEYL